MDVLTLLTDDWHEHYVTYTNVNTPTWDQIETAIRALDSERRTNMIIRYTDDSAPTEVTSPTADRDETSVSLCVGGGKDGQFVMVIDFATPTDLHGFRYLDPSRPEDPRVELIVGGQGVDYPPFLIADLSTVLRAVRFFIDSGQMEPSMTWVETGRLPGSHGSPRDWDDTPW